MTLEDLEVRAERYRALAEHNREVLAQLIEYVRTHPEDYDLESSPK